MHREIDAAVEERLLDLLGEEALAADLGEPARLLAIAGGTDRHQLGVEPGVRGAHPVADQPGLVKRHWAATGADSKGHGSSSTNVALVLAELRGLIHTT